MRAMASQRHLDPIILLPCFCTEFIHKNHPFEVVSVGTFLREAALFYILRLTIAILAFYTLNHMKI